VTPGNKNRSAGRCFKEKGKGGWEKEDVGDRKRTVRSWDSGGGKVKKGNSRGVVHHKAGAWA